MGCVGGAESATVAASSGSLSSGGIVIPPASGWGDTGVTSTLNADGSVSWCCTTWIVPLPVAAGDVIGTVSVPVRDNGPNNGFSTGGNTVVVFVGTPSSDGSTFNALLYATTSGAGDLATVTLTFATPHVVVAGENLQIRLKAQTPGIFGPTPATHVSWAGAAIAAGPTPQTVETYSIGFAIPGPGVQLFPGSAFTAPSLALGTSTASSNLPMRIAAGRMLVGWSVRFIKNSSTGTISARLWRATTGSGAAIQIGSIQQLIGQGAGSIGASGLTDPTPPNASYFIEVQGGGSAGDYVMDYQDTMQ
jgi:hypothetical protein